MFSHVFVGTDDLNKARYFYDTVMPILGYGKCEYDAIKKRLLYISIDGVFGVTLPIDGKPASVGNGITIGFKARETKNVDEWYSKGISFGGQACEDPPGIRVGAKGLRMYLAYLRDPSGNKICATCFNVPQK